MCIGIITVIFVHGFSSLAHHTRTGDRDETGSQFERLRSNLVGPKDANDGDYAPFADDVTVDISVVNLLEITRNRQRNDDEEVDVNATLPTDDPPLDEYWIPIQGIYTKLSIDSLSKIMLQAPVKNQTTISLSGNSSEIAHQATVGNKSWAFNNCDDLPHPYM